jgi:glucokinase
MNIVVDLGATNVRAGLESRGAIRGEKSILLESKHNLDATLTQLVDFLRPYTKKDVRSIGIGVPSVVDVHNGIVYNAVNIPSWEEVHLKGILESEFNIPVFVNNDVNCFVLGEHRFGVARNYQSVVGVCVGTGIGTGIIIDNQLYTGVNCGAGEIGHLPYLDQDLEFYASGNFFEKVYGLSAMEASLKMESAPEEGQPMWDAYGTHLAQALMTIVYSFDPEVIVLGGSLSKAYSYFENTLKSVMQERFAYPESLKRLKIFQSVDDTISLLGASLLSR